MGRSNFPGRVASRRRKALKTLEQYLSDPNYCPQSLEKKRDDANFAKLLEKRKATIREEIAVLQKRIQGADVTAITE
jgi:hypothetical protein